MKTTAIFFVVAALVAVSSSIPVEHYEVYPEQAYEIYSPVEIQRFRRSPDDGEWVFKPNVGRDAKGNTGANIELERKGEDHDFRATYSNMGPETWSVGGTFRW
ncbi:hypothetical protein Zmor_008505 [Zophobas morio]|uniref:Uncharacterized protein n=1 Tax=Zophobas morio TaxID=2755281 RepID=A0AA38J0L4_9CUCU|nr:hypothetical protein Zmor_008505 [Zophobas morio]